MRCMLTFISILALGATLPGCNDSGEQSLLVVVDPSIYETLEASLEQYAKTMRLADFDVYVEVWGPGTAWELRDFIFEQVDSRGIEGALLIGEGLPAAWYRQLGLYDGMEEFPMDLFLQDRDALWIDTNDDGLYDYHSELHADIYTSRLVGTATQLQDYFARLERYRREGPIANTSAFIFLDDDWSHKDTSDHFGLGELYSSVEVIQDKRESTLSSYLERLSGRGAEFVYQWIHGAPGWLAFEHVDETGELVQTKLFAEAVANYNLEASFVNMSNCYSARFTDPKPSLAQAYTVGTEYGLAVVGSTKVGAQTDPRIFHRGLARGMRWGRAYKKWFNEQGNENDLWHLGIVLVGDPLLRVHGDLAPTGMTDSATEAGSEMPAPDTPCCIADEEPGTFDDYRRRHPEFF